MRIALSEVAELTGAQLIGEGSCMISGIADLSSATASDASFFSNPRYADALKATAAGALFVQSPPTESRCKNFLICENPSRAFQILVEYFFSDRIKPTHFSGIHPTSVIDPSAIIEDHVTIGPHCTIEAHATVGGGSRLIAGCYLGPYSKIGKDCLLYPHVTIRERCILGDRVILQPGAVIGSCGFGLTTDSSGEHEKLQQVGHVVLEDDVEIGANTTIDRARFKETRIKRGVKIDNLVQIAHGVTVGEHSIIVAQSGIAGSSTLGKGVVMAGQSAVAGHLNIADGTILTARTGVSKSLTKPGQPYGGAPAMPLADYNRMSVYLRNIETFVKELNALKNR